MIEGVLIVLDLVRFTGPDDQRIEINRDSVVTVRKPRSGEHLTPGVHCVITLADGKFVAVVEPCNVVLERLTR